MQVKLFRDFTKMIMAKEFKHKHKFFIMILGITGKAGHGKNTVAEILKEACPAMDWQRVAFADALKNVFWALTGTVPIDTTDWKHKYLPEWGMTRREMLQRIGTDCLRNHFDPDIWVKALFFQMEPGKNYVITDVRFKNEVAKIEEMGGKLVRVIRHGYDNGLPPHESETDLDHMYFDTIHNATHSMNFLREQVFLMAYAQGWTDKREGWV